MQVYYYSGTKSWGNVASYLAIADLEEVANITMSIVFTHGLDLIIAEVLL